MKRLATFIATLAVSVLGYSLLTTTSASAATWTGGGDQLSFNDPENWGGVLPSAGETLNITPSGDNIKGGNHLNNNLPYYIGDINLTYSSWSGQIYIEGTTLLKGSMTVSSNSTKLSLLLEDARDSGSATNHINQLIIQGLSFGIVNSVDIQTLRLGEDAHIVTAGTGHQHVINKVVLLPQSGSTDICSGLGSSSIGTIELSTNAKAWIDCDISSERVGEIVANGNNTIRFGAPSGAPGTLTAESGLTLKGDTTVIGRSNLKIIWTGNVNNINGKLIISDGTNFAIRPSEGTEALDGDQPTLNVIIANNIVVVNGKRGDVTVQQGGILKGKGTVGALTVVAGGRVAPGESPGILNAGNTTFNEGSLFEVEIAGNTVGEQYDQLKVAGTVSLGSATLETKFLNDFKPKAGDVFTIIDNDGDDAVAGTFKDLPEGATFTVDGVVFKISYVGGDGNDVVLTVAEVPGTPNTGFTLLSASPFVTLLATLGSSMVILVIARKYGTVRS